MNQNFSNFHHFLRVYDFKVSTKSNQWAESARETRINSLFWNKYIGRYIPSYLATITNGALTFPSLTIKLTSESNQRYKRGQKSPLDPTVLAGPLQSGYSLAKDVKNGKNRDFNPPTTPGLKQIFGETNHVGVSGGSLWTFSHREIQINRPSFLLPSVIFSIHTL